MKKQTHSWSLGSGEMLIVGPPSFIRRGLIARVLPPGTTSQSHSEFPYSDLQGPPFLSPPFPHLFHLCHPETARPIPLLPPAHPTQCENDKDENLNDDTLPLPK